MNRPMRGLTTAVAALRPGISFHTEHQCVELANAQKETIRMSGDFLEIPLAIERFRHIVHAIQNDGDEAECLSGLVTIAQGASQQPLSQSLTLMILMHSQPR